MIVGEWHPQPIKVGKSPARPVISGEGHQKASAASAFDNASAAHE